MPSQKMECKGLKKSVIDLFESGLSRRELFVSLVFSDAGTSSWGVPWGSVIGSILFPMYLSEQSTAEKKLNQTSVRMTSACYCISQQGHFRDGKSFE